MNKRHISEIWIYPIKSLGGIAVPQARVFGKGLQWDRRWMLVDETNGFITQRVYPSMALFRMSMTETHLMASCHSETMQIPLVATVGDIF